MAVAISVHDMSVVFENVEFLEPVVAGSVVAVSKFNCFSFHHRHHHHRAITITITVPLPPPSRRHLHRVVAGIATQEERKEKKEKRGYAPNARIVPHAIILRIRSHIPRKRHSRAKSAIARRPLPPSDASRRRDTRISRAGVTVAIPVVGTILFIVPH